MKKAPRNVGTGSHGEGGEECHQSGQSFPRFDRDPTSTQGRGKGQQDGGRDKGGRTTGA